MPLLTKLSSPGWEKVFPSQEDARQELIRYICKSCLNGEDAFVGDNGILVDISVHKPDHNSIGELLGTACGCEFWYEEDDGTTT